MSEKVGSDWLVPVSMPGSLHLQKIADALNVPVDAFKSPEKTRVIHIDENGRYWILLNDAQGSPVVRCMSGSADQPTVEEDIFDFLMHDKESPQCQALYQIIRASVVNYVNSSS